MSEYIPKYPSEEGDDSNKTSSELLAKTLKPIYVPQELMLAWESHLASYSRDTHALLDQVKDSETALNTQYQALLTRVQKYEQMLQDITMDSNEFTMDTDEVNFTGWNILAQASYWDYLLRREITKLRDQIKSAEFKGSLVSEVSDSVLENLSKGNEHISKIIGAVTDSPLIRDLDAALSGTSTRLSDLRLAHETLKAKQYADAVALAQQNGETFDQLTLTFNDLISEQIDKIAEEAATRTRSIQELEDGITIESQLRHEGQETIATAVFALKASTETSIAGIKQEYSTIAGTNEAITSALTTYTAKVDKTLANITTDYVAYANLDSALVSKTDELLAIVNNNISKLNITNEITAGLSSVKAVSTVTVDLDGVVTGYGLISELENGIVKAAFGVNADTFYVGKPTDAVKPFVVTTIPTNIDGIDFPAGTWINSAIIANATIGSAHIKDASITNAHISELDASKITTGILEARRIRVGDTTQFDFGYAPTDVLNGAKTYTDTKTRTFTSQPTTPYSSGDIYRNGNSIYVCTTARTSGSYVASDWILVGDVTAYNTAADTAKVNGVDAATVVLNAANGAAVYADVMSDLKITPVEKAAINQEWNRIQKEYASLLAQAQALSLSTTAYTSAYTGLSTADPAMATILASMSTTTTLTVTQRDAYKTQYTTYYTQAVAITKAINDKIAANAKSYVDNVQIGGTNLALNTGVEVNQTYWAVVTASPLIVGKEYTLSFDYIGNVTGTVFLNDSVTKNYPAINSNTWIRASVTFVFVKNDYQGFELFPHVYGATKLRKLKLELGNKATEWAPAPEDVDAAIAVAKDSADAAYDLANTANSQLTHWMYPNSTYIDGGKIYTNSITANQISVGSLSAISANLGTIQVGTANIAEGAISTAKIGDLQVDTIKVKDNAITNGIASQNCTSLTIVTNGGQVRINVGIDYFRKHGYKRFTDTLILYRDGTELKRWSFSGYWNDVDDGWVVQLNQELPMVVDIVGAGTHTYSLNGLGTTSMALLEVKK